MKHFNFGYIKRLTAHGSRLISFLAAVLLLCFAFSSGSYAQSYAQKAPGSQGNPQKAPAITFKFSGDTNSQMLSNGKSSDKPLDVNPSCCSSLNASLIPIAYPCGSTRAGKKASTLDDSLPNDSLPCCCGQFIVSNPCTLPICEVSIGIEYGLTPPECCVVPPTGWTFTDEGPNPAFGYSDELLFENTSANCNGAIGPTPVIFDVCGWQEDLIKYSVTVTFCNATLTGCVPSSNTCSREFVGEIECPPAGVASVSVSQSLDVSQGFPNPASSSVQFNYTAPNPGLLTLSVVDVLGKTVSTTNRIVSQGSGNVTLGLSGEPAGNYYCVFELNGETVAKRLEVK